MTIRIVIADDHKIVRRGIRTFLELDPELVVVGEAADGAEAVRLAQQLQPDIVLMDLVMPGMDGIEATATSRSHPAYPAPGRRSRCMSATSWASSGCRAAPRPPSMPSASAWSPRIHLEPMGERRRATMSTPLNDALVASRATRSFNRSGALNTRLRGRRLILARVAWVTVVSLIVALFLVRLPAYYATLQTVCPGAVCGYVQPTLDSAQALQKLGLSVSAYATFTLALEIALAFLCFILGAVIFWRRSDDWMALLGALAVVASVTLNGNVLSMDMSSAWGWIAMGLYVLRGGVYVLFLSLSAGRFVTRWAPWLLLCWVVAVIHFFIFMDFFYSLVCQAV